MTARRDTLTLPSGQVITRATADAAADWLTLLMSGEVGDAQQQQWRQWRLAHADNEAAWQHVEAVTGRMKSLEPAPAYAALSPYSANGRPSLAARRRATRLLLWGGIATGIGLLGSRTGVWQTRTADYRSGTGEQRNLTLEDGTRLTLNTDSAVNLRFDDTQRRILLVAGEIMIATRHEPALADPRPLLVATAEGTIRSLGTRFTVRQLAGWTHVTVQESAVEISPSAGSSNARRLHAGEQTRFSRDAVEPPQSADAHADAWARGQLVADEQQLGEFLAEVGRYRPGVLRVDPQIAGLRLSGVFPLADTDRILATLPSVLPVRVQWRTRYWATVVPAD
ncbi:FecR domain-containing protein [Achromobacter spanius]|uniref:Iron dicitrate transport regulator FecR n=1 Tax=Achromobacter spanius TaxID=217203 RepID=A0A2S0IE38_9BURK|nr:FecR domain-containing protein [Achromobacter spanius]AVJ30300.1 iron dicitrate transport regulator FecR [Achromobacter spanius]